MIGLIQSWASIPAMPPFAYTMLFVITQSVHWMPPPWLPVIRMSLISARCARPMPAPVN